MHSNNRVWVFAFSFVDSNGNLVVKYEYTAYGTTTISGSLQYSIGAENPFRWKGYYYDTESGLYLVTTRYYNPEWCRWLNGDVKSLNPFDINGLNLYSFCGNNPITYTQGSASTGIPLYLQSGALGYVTRTIKSKTDIIASGSFRKGLFYGNGVVTEAPTSGYIGAKLDFCKEKVFEFGAFFGLSLYNFAGEIGIGNDNFSLSLIGDANIGTLSGAAGIIINPEKETYFLGIGIEAEVASANAGIRLKIFNFEIEVGGYASALSAGAYLGLGIVEGEFTGKYKSSAFFGYGFYFNIKF